MLQWKLREYLDEHKVSAYALTKHTDVAANTIYALARGENQRISLDVLNKILDGLESLTGRSVSVSDLLVRTKAEKVLEKLTAAGVPYTGDAETDIVLDRHPDILDRIQRHESGESGSRLLREIIADLDSN